MAATDQNFTKHFKDTFSIIYTVTDVTDDLSNYYAYFAIALTPSSSTALVEKSSNPAFSTKPAFNGGISLDLVSGVNQITVNITGSSDYITTAGATDKLYTGSFYHELTIGETQNGNDAVIIATGTITILDDVFSPLPTS